MLSGRAIYIWQLDRSKGTGSMFRPMQKMAAGPAKLRATATFLEALARNRKRVLAFVEVATDGYVPDGVEVRARFGARQFTAEFPPEILDRLLSDNGVTLIQPAEQLKPTSECT
jgi:hypothetical protein